MNDEWKAARSFAHHFFFYPVYPVHPVHPVKFFVELRGTAVQFKPGVGQE
jgi:hypothetical protein